MNYISCSYNKCADYAENTYFIGKYNDKARKYHNFLPELKRICRKKKPGKIFQHDSQNTDPLPDEGWLWVS